MDTVLFLGFALAYLALLIWGLGLAARHGWWTPANLPLLVVAALVYDCEHRDCATIWGLTLAYDRPCGCPRVDVSAPGGGVHQAAGRVGSDLIGA